MIGFGLFWVTAFCEIMSVANLATVNSTIDVIVKQVALACVAKVGIFYAGGLSQNMKIKQKSNVVIEFTFYRQIQEQVKLPPKMKKCHL